MKTKECKDCLVTRGILPSDKTTCTLHSDTPCCAMEVLKYLTKECKDQQAFLADCAKIFAVYPEL